MAPAVHASPADFAFGRETFAEAFRNVTSLTERFGDSPRVAFGILRPVRGARRRIDADDAVLADAEVAQFPADVTRLPDLGDEVPAVLIAAHCRSAAGRRPDGRHERTDDESSR